MSGPARVMRRCLKFIDEFGPDTTLTLCNLPVTDGNYWKIRHLSRGLISNSCDVPKRYFQSRVSTSLCIQTATNTTKSDRDFSPSRLLASQQTQPPEPAITTSQNVPPSPVRPPSSPYKLPPRPSPTFPPPTNTILSLPVTS